MLKWLVFPVKQSIASDFFVQSKTGLTRCCRRKRLIMVMGMEEKKQRKEKKSLIRLHLLPGLCGD